MESTAFADNDKLWLTKASMKYIDTPDLKNANARIGKALSDRILFDECSKNLSWRRNMHIASRCLLMIALIGVSVFSQEKTMIAVSALVSGDLSESETFSLTEALRSELGHTGQFQVMERTRMDEILKEQGFKQSGACDESCALEVGKLLSVQKIVLGSVGKVGNTHLVTVRLVDISSGKIIKEVSEKSRGSVDNILNKIIPTIAQKIAGTWQPPKPKKGAIVITTVVAVGAIFGVPIALIYYPRKDSHDSHTDVRVIWNE